MLSNTSIRLKVTLIIAIVAANAIAGGVAGFVVIDKVKVNGPIYNDIVQTKDLIADILPPPEYIIESYLTLFELAGEKNMEPTKEKIAYALQLRGIFGNSKIGMMQVYEGGVIAMVNQRLSGITGHSSPEELVGLHAQELHKSPRGYKDFPLSAEAYHWRILA